MKENLLIIFVKNPELGKVKTRLAEGIGNEKALEVYLQLLALTEKVTQEFTNASLHIYFTEHEDKNYWSEHQHFIQQGKDLGEKMQNAFENGFKLGFKNIVGIGSDLPDLSVEILQNAFDFLKMNDTVFGPAKDGGYYLLGMKKIQKCIFQNKAWSTDYLLNDTLIELKNNKITFSKKLPLLNDIDTRQDLQELKGNFFKS
ncbi:MAG: TIGR04282 family arsenosugar biosynthesis glycosyltransferase [Flavobacteriia bacterium]|jgi:rSAM/selenodomain-associated transferase 1